MANQLDRIPCTFRERKWMRSQKTWRCSVELPDHPTLPSVLTGMIESRVAIKIEGEVDITIDPADIIDVPHKGKKFMLVFETSFEKQANIGPHLTTLPDTPIKLTITPAGSTEPATTTVRNDNPLSARELQGLHVGFFRNEKFWEYLTEKSKLECHGEDAAKLVFKGLFGVQSCTEIKRESFTAFIQDFNDWLRG